VHHGTGTTAICYCASNSLLNRCYLLVSGSVRVRVRARARVSARVTVMDRDRI